MHTRTFLPHSPSLRAEMTSLTIHIFFAFSFFMILSVFFFFFYRSFSFLKSCHFFFLFELLISSFLLSFYFLGFLPRWVISFFVFFFLSWGHQKRTSVFLSLGTSSTRFSLVYYYSFTLNDVKCADDERNDLSDIIFLSFFLSFFLFYQCQICRERRRKYQHPPTHT
ncbi:unnamed protein product [Acanthosepion pharaonis]|uniref:Uncharacterized protein n=1 Tax=Acanthosepion pharaonis TaxID=158019 RepID=A0A812EIK3_ACAPH|nr:unnamed protein product [Sepia pharaonis]